MSLERLSQGCEGALRALRVRRFGDALRDTRGGIMVTAALSMLPITMLCFAGVEFANITRQRTALQAALDSAALAVARAPTSSSQAQLRAVYLDVLKGHLELKPGLVDLVEAAPDPVTGVGGQPELTYVDGRVTANASLAISPIIASFFVKGPIVVSGGTEVRRESKGLEVALVLDNTGSMNTNNRIGIARTAATNFVSELEKVSAATGSADKIKIGLVPFAATVKVGSAYETASWIDAAGNAPISKEIFATATGQMLTGGTNRFTLLSQMGIAWGGCVESRAHPYDVQDAAPSASTPATLFTPYFAPDEPDYLPTGANVGAPGDYNNSNNWNANRGFQLTRNGNSYVWDLKQAVRFSQKAGNDQRLQGLWSGYLIDFSSTPYYVDKFKAYTNSYFGVLGVTAKYTTGHLNAELVDPFRPLDGFSRTNTVRGPNKGCDIRPITRLTNNYTALKNDIAAMVAAGSTNIPMGLVWGWHLLSPTAPFGDGSAYDAKGVTKVVVLMTDGDNLIEGWQYSGTGYASQNRLGTTSSDPAILTAKLNERQALLCSNMKAKGIVIYAVRVEQATGDPTTMRNCASGADYFFDVKTAAELDPTFRQIAMSIQSLRIAS